MRKLVWLASYPKSGNTWVRAFLDAYRRGPGEPIDINDFACSIHAASRSVFDRVAGIPSANLTFAEIDRLRPLVHQAVNDDADEPVFVKVHERWRRTNEGMPMFPPGASRLAVVIVRNPLGIAASLANHNGCAIEQAIEMMADPSYGLAASTSRLSRQLPQPVGAWHDHLTSWLDQAEIPVHLVRYEDLTASPEAVFAGLLLASGLDVDADLVADAVERAQFDRLRAAEDDSGFRERRPRSERFFRRGDPESWRRELDRTQIEQLLDVHGPAMARVGYSIDVLDEPRLDGRS
jgi:hypothetical protein